MTTIICFDISEITDDKLDFIYGVSSFERKEKAGHLKQKADKIRCITAGILLKFALLQKNHDDKLNEKISADTINNVEIVKNSYGKPYIKNINNFFFNISHSAKWVIVAYGDDEVGVDIEKIECSESSKKIAERFFTEEEINYVYNENIFSHEKFYEVWTGKEAYLKYVGVGISKALDSVNTIHLKEEGLKGKIFKDDYYLSVFDKHKDYQIKIISFDDIYESFIN